MTPARRAFDLAEVLEHVIFLGADRFPFARDQAALGHLNGGNTLFGDQRFDLALTEHGVGAEVACSLQRAGQQLAAQAAGRVSWLPKVVELQGGRIAKLGERQGVHQPLAQHAVGRTTDRGLPLRGGLGHLLGQPLLFFRAEIYRAHPIRCIAAGDPLQFQQLPLEALSQPLAFLAVDHLHKGAWHQAAAPLLQGFAVHHQSVLRGDGIKGGWNAGSEIGLRQPWPTRHQGHQQADHQQAGFEHRRPAQHRPSGRFVAKPAVPKPA